MQYIRDWFRQFWKSAFLIIEKADVINDRHDMGSSRYYRCHQ